MILKYAKQFPDNKRVRIIEAVSLICSRYQHGEDCTTIMMPPRYGKSSVIRLSALELMSGTSFPAIMTAPWSDNVDQIKQKSKIEEMYDQYGIPHDVKFVGKRRSETLISNKWWQTEGGIPTLLTCTIGLIQNSANQQQFIDGIADMYQRYGKRIPFFIDEAHLIKETQQWGRFILEVQKAGAYLVLLTGTPVPGIPGFRINGDNWIDVVRHVPRREIKNGEVKHFLDTYEGNTRKITSVAADLNVTWEEAWNVGALAEVNSIWVDVEVFDDDTGESLGQLSERPKAELNGRLKGIEESPEMVAKKADAGVDRLLQLQSDDATSAAQMLIITGTDREGKGSNIHARQYCEAVRESLRIRGYDPGDFRMEIATGVDNDGNPNPESARLIKAFREGEIDFLFVKSMGIVGMDAPSCKVLVFGSTLRNGPMAIQTLSRVLTQWLCHATMILSNDKAMTELYKRVVKDNGGETSESALHLVESVEVEPPHERPVWDYKNAAVSQYSDELGGVTTGDFELELRIIKRKFHTKGLSDRQIIENHTNGGFPINDDDREQDAQARRDEKASGITDLDEGLDAKKGMFGATVKQIVGRHVNYGLNPKLYVEKVKDLTTAAKRICGIGFIKVDKIDDVALLKRLIDALPQAEKIMFGGPQ